jgi:hypothetical protein
MYRLPATAAQPVHTLARARDLARAQKVSTIMLAGGNLSVD